MSYNLKRASLLSLFVFISFLSKAQYTQWVNPFVGTGGHGHTFPGATLPFGMVQLSPDTRLEGWDGCSGYHYTDSILYGFSHTHLSGTGVADYGDILLMPILGSPKPNNGYDGRPGYSQLMDKSSEKADPGYYRVRLPKTDIQAEMTSTLRVGVHRYTFPASDYAGILLDLKHRDRVTDSYLRIVNKQEVEGYRVSEAWAKEQHLYFVMRFSRPFDGEVVFNNDSLLSASSLKVKNIKASFQFVTKDQEPITVLVGISAVSMEGARRNLNAECTDFDFDRYRNQAHQIWEKELGRIQVESKNQEHLKKFYTALYHCYIHPNVFSDIDNQYRGMDQKIHTSKDGEVYTIFSLWDTYRALHPLMNLIDKKRSLQFVRTFLHHYEDGKLLPVWELAANETFCMIGYHSVPVITDAYRKGIRGFNEKLALEAMENSAKMDHFGLASYRKNGCVFSGDDGESVSKTLEYAFDDWCIGEFAGLIGNEQKKKEYWGRSLNYRNLFDRNTGFFRAKNHHAWLKTFDPYEVNFNFTEANAWQYCLSAQHDIEGLSTLLGGKTGLEKKLDAIFSASTRTSGREQADMTGFIGQYVHGNEPSHHIAWLYHYAGRPDKTQEKIRFVLDSLYADKPDGLCGNEDCGQMSAWFVLSSLGLYSVTPGSDTWCLTTPLFDKVDIRLESGKHIRIANKGAANQPYIGSMRVNGKPWTASWIRDGVLEKGVDIEITRSEKPGTWGKGGKDMPKQSVEFPGMPSVNPSFEAAKTSFLDTLQIKISHPDAKAKLYYTLNGNTPDSTSRLYTGPLVLENTATVKAIAYTGNGQKSRVIETQFIRSRKNWDIKIEHPWTKQYACEGVRTLIDEIKGGDNFRSGVWQGYQYNDLNVTLDLKQEQIVNKIAIRCLQEAGSWIWMPTEVVFELSNDGTNWRVCGKEVSPVDPRDGKAQIHSFECLPLVEREARYVRIKAKNIKTCPEWHLGAGGGAFIFADEIDIE